MALRPAIALTAALLYTGAAGTANADGIDAAERAQLQALAVGEMSKMEIHAEPRAALTESFEDAYGNDIEVEDFAGRVVLVNFWATWCPPCVAEMPSLDDLEGAMGGEDFAVVAISADRGGVEIVQRFYERTMLENLEIYLDPRRAFGKKVGIIGLPITLVLDREGREIARFAGDAHWNGPEAQAFLSAVIEMTSGPATERAELAPAPGDG